MEYILPSLVGLVVGITCVSVGWDFRSPKWWFIGLPIAGVLGGFSNSIWEWLFYAPTI